MNVFLTKNRNKCNNLVKNNNTKTKTSAHTQNIHTRTYMHTTLRRMDAWETDDMYLLVEKRMRKMNKNINE